MKYYKLELIFEEEFIENYLSILRQLWTKGLLSTETLLREMDKCYEKMVIQK